MKPNQESAPAGLNCLTCRLCSLERDSDFSQKSPTIFCGAIAGREPVGRRVLNLGGCPQAVAMPHNNRRIPRWSPVATQWLRARYDSLPMRVLSALLHKTPDSIKSHAYRNRISSYGSGQAKAVRARLTARRKEARFAWNTAQIEFLRECFFDDARWLLMGGAGHHAAENARRRDAIIQGVAMRGESKSWSAINAFVAREIAPGGPQRKRERARYAARVYRQKKAKAGKTG